MKLAISNILWPSELDEDALDLACALGANGIEIAPGRLGGWDVLTPDFARAYHNKLAARGLQTPAMQALFFGCKGMQLLGSEEEFTALNMHLGKVAAIAQALEAKLLVFGAPAFRKRGILSHEEALDLAAPRLRKLAQTVHAFDTSLGLEAVAPDLGCDFINTTPEATALVRAVDHPGLKLHIDLGTIISGNEDITTLIGQNIDIIGHVHFSRPGLAPINTTLPQDEQLANELAQVHYEHWVSVEIKPQDHPLQAIEESLILANSHFRSKTNRT